MEIIITVTTIIVTDIIITEIIAVVSGIQITIRTETKTIREADSETSNSRITPRDRRTAADLETVMETPTTPEADSEDNDSKLRKRTANPVRFSFLYSNFASSFFRQQLWNFINIRVPETTL
jgi:hypothetical protein